MKKKTSQIQKRIDALDFKRFIIAEQIKDLKVWIDCLKRRQKEAR